MNQDTFRTSPPEEVAPSAARSRFRLQFTLLGVGILLIALGWLLAVFNPEKNATIDDRQAYHEKSQSGTDPDGTSQSSAEEVDPVPHFRPEQMEGRWERKGTINRDITILPDGKATLIVQLDYLSSLVYGREMEMELSWELEDDILTHTIVSGSPKANVKRLIRDFGDSLSYRVVKVDDTELVLEDLDDDMAQHHWKAIKPAPAAAMK